MASLAFLLGTIPSTDKVEAADDQLRADYAAYKEFENSDELKRYFELENEVTSSDFAIRKKKILKEKYKASDEYRKESRYKQLINKVKRENMPEELIELEKEVQSDAFMKRLQFLKMNPKERYESTEEYAKESEFEALKKSEKFIWYFKTKKKYPFKEVEKWELTFSESFNDAKLDTEKWMNRFYYGEEILDEAYTMSDDISFPTNGKNVEFYDNKARLVTKQEEIEGMKWNPGIGFLKDTFEYTSALISTGKSFRQKFGKFKAKIKMSSTDISQVFWLAAESATPHIEIARYESGKLASSFAWNNGSSKEPSKTMSKTNGSKYATGFFIFELEWSPEKLIWKINDKVFKTQSSGVPQEEMYMVFSTALKQWSTNKGLPSGMEIDWVRAYKMK